MKIATGGKQSTPEYVWTDRYDVSDYRGMIDSCGAALGEGRFSTPIDVSLVRRRTIVIAPACRSTRWFVWFRF